MPGFHNVGDVTEGACDFEAGAASGRPGSV